MNKWKDFTPKKQNENKDQLSNSILQSQRHNILTRSWYILRGKIGDLILPLIIL